MGNKTGEDYMKVLKDPYQVLQIMNRKLDELQNPELR